MNPSSHASLAILRQQQEDRDFRKWLDAGGAERVAGLRARFEAEANRHKPPEFETRHTPAGTPYRVLKRTEEQT